LERLNLVVNKAVTFGLIVVAGGIGTGCRAALEAAFPSHGWPWTTFCINISGAVLLACLVEVIAVFGPDNGWRRLVRLGAGTGLLGGFTTYSTFSVETVNLMKSGDLWLGATYALGSVLLGVALAFAAGRLLARLLRKAAG